MKQPEKKMAQSSTHQMMLILSLIVLSISLSLSNRHHRFKWLYIAIFSHNVVRSICVKFKLTEISTHIHTTTTYTELQTFVFSS